MDDDIVWILKKIQVKMILSQFELQFSFALGALP